MPACSGVTLEGWVELEMIVIAVCCLLQPAMQLSWNNFCFALQTTAHSQDKVSVVGDSMDKRHVGTSEMTRQRWGNYCSWTMDGEHLEGSSGLLH